MRGRLSLGVALTSLLGCRSAALEDDLQQCQDQLSACVDTTPEATIGSVAADLLGPAAGRQLRDAYRDDDFARVFDHEALALRQDAAQYTWMRSDPAPLSAWHDALLASGDFDAPLIRVLTYAGIEPADAAVDAEASCHRSPMALSNRQVARLGAPDCADPLAMDPARLAAALGPTLGTSAAGLPTGTAGNDVTDRLVRLSAARWQPPTEPNYAKHELDLKLAAAPAADHESTRADVARGFARAAVLPCLAVIGNKSPARFMLEDATPNGGKATCGMFLFLIDDSTAR